MSAFFRRNGEESGTFSAMKKIGTSHDRSVQAPINTLNSAN